MKLVIKDILRQEDVDYIDHLELENRRLKQELGLMKISLDHKTTLLNSCEIALEREQFPQE